MAHQKNFIKRPREVYKEKKIKEYISREGDRVEQNGLEVSNETYLLAKSPSDITSLKTSSFGQKAFDSITPPASTSSRPYSLAGVGIQHSRTNKGTKVFVSIQTPEDQVHAQVVSLTAELKHYSRVREVKNYQPDSDLFTTHIASNIGTIQQMETELRNQMFFGRLHERGKRSKWFANMFLIAVKQDTAIIRCILAVEINGVIEEYVIVCDKQMSSRQQQAYHSSGYWGEIVTQTQSAPTLQTAVRNKMKSK